MYAIRTTSEETARKVWEILKTKGKETLEFWASKIGVHQYDEGIYANCFGYCQKSKEGHLYTEITDVEYIKMNTPSKQDRLKTLEEQAEKLRKEIEEETNFKVGDYVVATISAGGNGTSISLWQYIKNNVYKVKDFNGITVITVQDELGSTNNGMGKQFFRKATKEEIEAVQQKEYALPSGMIVTIKKGAIWANSERFGLSVLNRVYNSLIQQKAPGADSNSTSYTVQILDMDLQVGCQKMKLSDLKAIKKIVDELNN